MKKIWVIMMLCGIFPHICFPQYPSGLTGVWNEMAVFNCQTNIKGLAFNGHDIYTLGGGAHPYNNILNRFNPQDTSFSQVCNIPSLGDMYQWSGGLTYKSPWFVSTEQWFNQLWFEPSRAVYFDTAGILQGSSTLPHLDIHIICWDNDHFWGCEPGNNQILKIDPNGNILKTIGPLPLEVSNICTQGSFIWVTSTNDTIYKIDDTGAIMERHASIMGAPLAVVFDGLHLWYSCEKKLVKVEVFGTGTPGLRSPLDPILHVYPNPSSDKITIETIYKGQLSVFTINGQEIMQQAINKPTTIINVSTLPIGVYVLKMVGEKGVQVEKIIRQ
jgi:hypothetical protein